MNTEDGSQPAESLTRMDRAQTMEMAQLILERRHILTEILKLSIAQEAALNEGLVESLVAKLHEKSTVVDRLRSVQQKLAPYADCPKDQRDWPEESEREACQQMLEESKKLQAAILEIDKRCEREMAERKEELFGAMQANADASRAANAYNQVVQRPHFKTNSTDTAGGRGGSLDVTSN